MVPNPLPDAAATAKLVAAIDIGSNSVRMVIAEVSAEGQIRMLERLQRAVRLGQDTFRRGRLGVQSMRAATGVLRDYQQMLRLYNVERIRAVATSAVREATNADTFLDRIFMATELQVEVIDTSEESRLTVMAVHASLGGALRARRDRTLVVDVGGGSTLLTVLENGEIITAQSLRLGSIRLQEVLSTSQETPQRSAEILRQQILKEVATMEAALPVEAVATLIAVGGDARFAARQIGQPTEADDLIAVRRSDLEKLVKHCKQFAPEELAKRHGLPFAEAETITPALLVYQTLLARTHARQMLVSQVSMRDGLLLELARQVTGQRDDVLLEGTIHSAMAVAEKFHVDAKHANSVAQLSIRLFDEMQAEHGLSGRYRLLLQVAGLLHEVGSVVSLRAHHKHSYYLIANSEIFGLTRQETTLVAHIARYHRRSVPKPSHLEYIALPRELRVAVNKLAALLRVADALSRGPLQEAGVLRLQRQGDELIIHVPGGSSLLLEQRALAAKGDLFEDIYGMKVRLEQV